MIQFKSKMLLLLSLLMITGTALQAQIWQIGYTSMTFIDASRGNRVIDANVFYPADVTGWNTPIGSPVSKRFPVVVFGHDEATGFSNYQYVWDQWVPKGFIVVMPMSEMGANMDVEEFGKDMAFIAAQFKVLRNTPGSFWELRHNNRSAMIGHGKGGSAAVIATQHHYQIKALMTLAANETAPGTIAAASLVTVPSVVVAGGEDCVSPVGTVQEAIFNNIASDCKTFINFTAVPRCHFAQNSGLCTASEVTCGGPMPYPWQSTTNATTYYLVSFMRHFLKSNEPSFDKFEWKLAQKKDDFLYVVMCNESVPVSSSMRYGDEDEDMLEQDFAVLNVNMYPNPVAVGHEARMTIETDMDTKAELVITNLMGQIMTVSTVELTNSINEIVIPTDNLRKGNFLVTITSPGQRISKPLIVN